MEFSKDFLEGKSMSLPIAKGSEQAEVGGTAILSLLYISTQWESLFELKLQKAESESEAGESAAPTDVYLSPLDTPHRLSLLDLTLTRDASEHDLRHQLKAMLEGKRRCLCTSVNFSSEVLWKWWHFGFYLLNSSWCLWAKTWNRRRGWVCWRTFRWYWDASVWHIPWSHSNPFLTLYHQNPIKLCCIWGSFSVDTQCIDMCPSRIIMFIFLLVLIGWREQRAWRKTSETGEFPAY